MAPLIRPLHKGDVGPDVLALKRALRKALPVRYAALMVTVGPVGRRFGSGVDRALRAFQRAHHLAPDGVLGPKTYEALQPNVDRYGHYLFAQAPRKTPAEEKYAELLSFMQRMSADTPGYLLGGGHGVALTEVSTRQKLDCSSSCALALYHVGLFPDSTAWVSGEFADRYGSAGTGQLFTVYANGDHVWIRLYRGPYWRFDTSPHGDGGFGPRLRKLPRFTAGFAARHWLGY